VFKNPRLLAGDVLYVSKFCAGHIAIVVSLLDNFSKILLDGSRMENIFPYLLDIGVNSC